MTVSNQPNLIILAPGLYAPPQSMIFLERNFQKQDFDTLTLHYPHLGTHHPSHTAERVTQKVSEAISVHDHTTFVGHSLGGIIGRELIQTGQIEVDAYVSIATPHYGYRKHLAPMVNWNQGGASVEKDSHYLTSLNSSDWLVDTKCLSIIATADMVVDPISQKCPFSNSNDELVEVNAGHIGVIFLPQTFWEIWSWLAYTLNVGV